MGVFIAFLIGLSWAAHLFYVLNFQTIDISQLSFWLHIILQSWLFTGLFITAHDAMHGTVARNKTLNTIIGFAATMLYAGMWYPVLLRKHRLHHAWPGTTNDPDYHVGNQNFFAWGFHL